MRKENCSNWKISKLVGTKKHHTVLGVVKGCQATLLPLPTLSCKTDLIILLLNE